MSIEIITAPLVPDTAASIWFMAHWAPAGPWVLTAIVPDGGGVESAAFMPGQEDKMVAWINSRNATANIYFAVNPLLPSFTDPLLAGKSGKCVKAKKTDVAALAWIHADIDPRPISPGEDIDPQAWVRSEAARAIKRLYGFTPRPTALVYSGAGVQAFWRLAEPIPINGDPELAAAAEGYNLGMALALESDHVHNCDRIMRLSGTINWPDAKKRAKGRIPWRAATIEFFPDRAYPESDFTRAEVRKTVAASSGTAMVPAGSRTSTLPNGIDDLDRFMVDERTTTIILRAKLIITWGRDKEKPKAKDDSRSEWVFDVLCNLLRANVPDDLIHGTVTDPRFQISESVLKNPDDVWRRLEDAKAVVARDADPASPARAAGKPNGILMVAGELNAILDEAEDALLASGVPIYQRGELVRLSTVNVARAKKVPDVIKRAEGSTILTPVTDRWLLQQMARSISWSALNKKGDPSPPIRN